MSTVATSTTVFTNREFPFKEISLSESLEKRNRKYYIDYHIQDQPIFFQINKVVLSSEPIFIDDEQGYIDVEIKERIGDVHGKAITLWYLGHIAKEQVDFQTAITYLQESLTILQHLKSPDAATVQSWLEQVQQLAKSPPLQANLVGVLEMGYIVGKKYYRKANVRV